VAVTEASTLIASAAADGAYCAGNPDSESCSSRAGTRQEAADSCYSLSVHVGPVGGCSDPIRRRGGFCGVVFECHRMIHRCADPIILDNSLGNQSLIGQALRVLSFSYCRMISNRSRGPGAMACSCRRGQIKAVKDAEEIGSKPEARRVKAAHYRANAWNKDERAHRRTRGYR
jgi:hypothetical protein